ncbi:unnamed protein product [Arctogadus glacialis]
MVVYVERLLREELELRDAFELRVERAHRALMPKPPGESPPRSIVVRMSTYRKEELLMSIGVDSAGDTSQPVFVKIHFVPTTKKKVELNYYGLLHGSSQ